jgi:hypothetical protein
MHLSFPKYIKLEEMAIVHVPRSVENEHCFSSLAVLKNKLRVTLDPHLPLVFGMYSHKFFTVEPFPHNATFDV